MTLHEEQEKVQKAMNASLSGLQEDPWLARRILADMKGEEPMAKKLSVSMILIIVLLVLSISAALAAGLGLFGELSQANNADERLPALENAAAALHAAAQMGDDIAVDISQAYFEGNRVFISYHVTGDWFAVALHEGAPDKDYQWNDVREHFVCAEHMLNDHPQGQRAIDFLDGKEPRWVEMNTAALADGLYLADGTYLDIIGGDERIQEDGSLVGWKECEIPEGSLSPELTFKAVLNRGHSVQFQDGDTYRAVYERGEKTELTFTLSQNTRCTYLKGASAQESYQAEAVLACGQVDVKGALRLTCPEAWVKVWDTWEGGDKTDLIENWYLYQNGCLIGKHGVQEISVQGTNALSFTLMYPAVSENNGLTLVPVYSLSGEHPQEALAVELIAK